MNFDFTDYRQRILKGYNTKNMTLAEAQILVDMVRQSRSMKYPDDNERLKRLCHNILAFMKQTNLTETAFNEELSKKVKNFDVSIAPEAMKKENFEHIQLMPLDMHANLIAIKFGINYP